MGRIKDDLFSPRAHARATDPGTSHAAAAGVTKKLTAIQEQVLLLFKVRREMTDLDLQAAFGTGRSTHRTRRRELVDLGYLRDSGRTKHQEGSNRVIWEIIP